MSKERIQILQIDMPVCSLIYGVEPCGATGAQGQECYNTLKTCQSVGSYTEEIKRYYFSTESESAYINSANWYPTLQAVSKRPAEINIVSIDPDATPLGKRESVKVTLKDHPHHDRGVDPYYSTRSYVNTVLEQGTFWSKWLARNDNYDGLSCVLYEGYTGQTMCDMRQYHLILDRIDNNSNTTTITAKDILKAADDQRVKVPAVSTGVLSSDIGVSTTSFSIKEVGSPSTVADTYASQGTLSIGDEAMLFTRTGHTFNVVRGAWGTTATEHSENDVVQQAYETVDHSVSPATGMRVDNIIKDILLNYVGVDTAWIDSTAWDNEGAEWVPTFIFNTVVLKPTGAGKLIGELLRDSACYLIPNTREKKIEFRALRPPVTTHELTDENNIIAGSFKIDRKPELRITQLYFWYDILDVTESTKELKNFKKVYVELSDDVNRARTQRDKTITSRWHQSENSGQVQIAAGRIMTRYGREPITFSFDVDSKDIEGADGLKLGDVFLLTHRDYVDETGSPKTIPAQIISMQDKERGHITSIKAQPFEFEFRARLWAPDGLPDWLLATPEQQSKYLYWSDDTGQMSNGEDAPKWL
ncbi:MAG: hypothetical protein D6711_13780 [Chloroflexi bacterium]|nr:MAG: hypothetical protein D6711_13780 [Chloroflexota bacterium]